MSSAKKKSIRILGIDPGTLITGYGVIEVSGNSISAIDYGCVNNKTSTTMPIRYKHIYETLVSIIQKNNPDCMSIEKLFHCKNVQSALKLGEARGVAILAGAQNGLDIFEYEPRKIKQSVVGYGAAHKSQVKSMIKSILHIDKMTGPSDVSDALAIAVCHAHHLNNVRLSALSESGDAKTPKRSRMTWAQWFAKNKERK